MDKKPNYSSLFYFNPLPSWVYDFNTFKILDVNEAAVEHYGYTKQEFLALTIKDLRPKEEISKLMAAHTDIDKLEGNLFFGVFTHQKKNGERIRMRINGHKVDYLDKDSMMVVCQDVTHEEEQLKILKESEEALRESEARFRTIFEIATLGIAQVDPSIGKIILVNSFYESITGYSKEELFQMSFVELTHPDDREKDWEIFSKAIRGEGEYRNEKRYIRKDGSIVWVRLHLAFIRDETGKPYRTVAICEDITAKKDEEHRLKLLESVITNTNDAILITEAEPVDDPGPRILYVNEAFTKMTGYTADEVIGKSPRLLQGSKSDKSELARLGKSLRKWESCEITTTNYKKNGEEFWINFSVSPVADEKGWFTHWIAIERDVTEQKQKEIEKELLAKISLNFSFENDLTTSLNELCKTVTEFGDFDFAEIWLPNIENTYINLIAHNPSKPNADIFYKWSEGNTKFKFEEGITGRVWKNKKAVIWDEINKKDDFVRKEAAAKANIKSALGIPLLFNKNIVGVLVIASQFDAQYLHKYINLFNQLEQYIGSEINRKKLENDLSHLYDAIPDIICVVDFQGRFLKMNNAGCTLLGYTEEEILYHSFEEFVHPEDRDSTTKEVANQAKGKNTLFFENRYLTKSGDVCWLSWTCNTSLKEGLVYASAKNITPEKKLRELNRTTSKLARIGSWEVDLLKNKMYWSEMVHELHETISMSFEPELEQAIDFYREDFRPQITKAVNQCIQLGTPFDLEAVIVTTNKNELWVRAIGNAEFIDDKCIRIYGSFQDIQDRKEAELRLQSLAENLPGVVFQYILYPDGKDALKYVTKGANEIWEYSPEEVMENVDLVWNQIRAGGDFDKVQQNIKESLKSKGKWVSRFKSISPSGKIRTLLGTGTPSFLSDGTVLYNSVVLDITKETQNEELLKQASDMAKIGSWGLDLINQSNDAMYWSPMTRKILEVDENYPPSLTGGFEFYKEESKARIQQSIESLIKTGKEFDEELLITTTKGKEKWIRCIGKSERAQGKCVSIFGSIQDIHRHKVSEIQLAEKSKLLAVVADVIAGFLKSEVWTEGLEKNFKIIGECVGVDRVYYFERNVDPITKGVLFSQRLEWNSGAATAQINNPDLQNIPEETIPDFLSPLSKGEFYQAIVSELPDTVVRTLLQEQQIKSIIALPILIGEVVYGFVGFDDCVNERKWTEDEVFFLKSITSNLSAAIQRQKDQVELQAAFTEKNNILESIGDAFFSVNKEGVVTYWNKESEIVLDKKRDEIIGKNLWEEYANVIDSEFYRQYHKAMQTGEVVHFEEQNPNLGKWFEVSAYPTRNNLSVYFRDITLKKEADIRLLQANERFEKVSEATNDAIWDFDVVNNYLFWGKGFYTLFGYNPDEIKPTFDLLVSLIHEDDRERVVNEINKYMTTPKLKDWYQEYRFLKSDNTYAFVIDRATFLRNTEGNVERVIGAMNDITERKNFEQQLLELNESLKKHARELEITNEDLEHFATIVSHDLQEPLRMISSFMDLLKRKYENQLDEKAHQYIYFAADGAKRMKKIILDLLEYSRAGKFIEAREMVDLNELVVNYQALRRKIIHEKSVEICVDKLPKLESHKAPFTQTLHCLLDNAIYYSKEGQKPKITISVKDIGDFWEIQIADNGIGIDPQFHEKIFVIFQRLHNRDRYEGTGIGLSIVKKHVESWGGKIWLESTSGEGATFHFTVPKTQYVE